MAKRRQTARAAAKGWQTRRANAVKRSRAAVKGWQTRRRHERAKRARATLAEFIAAVDEGADYDYDEFEGNADYANREQ